MWLLGYNRKIIVDNSNYFVLIYGNLCEDNNESEENKICKKVKTKNKTTERHWSKL